MSDDAAFITFTISTGSSERTDQPPNFVFVETECDFWALENHCFRDEATEWIENLLRKSRPALANGVENKARNMILELRIFQKGLSK